jgi:hypothetical protein
MMGGLRLHQVRRGAQVGGLLLLLKLLLTQLQLAVRVLVRYLFLAS